MNNLYMLKEVLRCN